MLYAFRLADTYLRITHIVHIVIKAITLEIWMVQIFSCFLSRNSLAVMIKNNARAVN